jgi:hypothetical protein
VRHDGQAAIIPERVEAAVTERSPAEIEAEIAAARERLAGTVDEIAERVKPANIAREIADSAKSQVVDSHGHVRVARVAVVAAIVTAYVALRVWRYRANHR